MLFFCYPCHRRGGGGGGIVIGYLSGSICLSVSQKLYTVYLSYSFTFHIMLITYYAIIILSIKSCSLLIM